MRRWQLMAVFALLAGGAALAQAPRLAVLPFANRGAPQDAWLAAGLEGALLDDLSRMKSFQPVSRRDRRLAAESVASDLAARPPARAGEGPLLIARAAGAAFLISGEYRVAGAEVAVSARLSRADRGETVSAISVQGSLAGIAGLDDEIIIGLFSGIDVKKASPLKIAPLSASEIKAIQAMAISRDEFEYRGRQAALTEAVPVEFLDIKEAVFRALNAERAKAGAAPFAYNQKLAFLGRVHSQNMIRHKFFGFTDQDGLDSVGRKQKLAPELLGNVGQAIAFNYGGNAAELAGKFTRQWLASESRQAILDPDYRSVGVGVFRGEAGGFRYYCTVVPADLSAELVSSAPVVVPFGETREFRFRFDGGFPKNEAAVIVRFPDKAITVYKKDGSYTVGFGFFAPQNWDGDFFSIVLPCDKGRGLYLLQAARGDQYVPEGFSFEVK